MAKEINKEACCGYVLQAMQAMGFSELEIWRMEKELDETILGLSEQEAADAFHRWNNSFPDDYTDEYFTQPQDVTAIIGLKRGQAFNYDFEPILSYTNFETWATVKHLKNDYGGRWQKRAAQLTAENPETAVQKLAGEIEKALSREKPLFPGYYNDMINAALSAVDYLEAAISITDGKEKPCRRLQQP